MKPSVVFCALVLGGAASVAEAQVTQSYSYDANGRLVGVSTSGSGGTNTAAYSYDKAHNRTQRVRSGTSSYAALDSLPDGGLLLPFEALVSPDGMYTLALRPSGTLELWRQDEQMRAFEVLDGLKIALTEAGATLALVEAQQPHALWSVTDDGDLIATANDGLTTLWSSAAGIQ